MLKNFPSIKGHEDDIQHSCLWSASVAALYIVVGKAFQAFKYVLDKLYKVYEDGLKRSRHNNEETNL
jgi:hypothetical protein